MAQAGTTRARLAEMVSTSWVQVHVPIREVVETQAIGTIATKARSRHAARSDFSGLFFLKMSGHQSTHDATKSRWRIFDCKLRSAAAAADRLSHCSSCRQEHTQPLGRHHRCLPSGRLHHINRGTANVSAVKRDSSFAHLKLDLLAINLLLAL